MSDANDQLVDLLRKRRHTIMEILRPHQDAVRELKGELDEVEALLRRHGAIEADSEDPSFIRRRGSEDSLPDQAAFFALTLLEKSPNRSIAIKELLNEMPLALRSRFNDSDAVAVEALRGQIRSRQEKFGLIYGDGLIRLNNNLSPVERMSVKFAKDRITDAHIVGQRLHDDEEIFRQQMRSAIRDLQGPQSPQK